MNAGSPIGVLGILRMRSILEELSKSLDETYERVLRESTGRAESAWYRLFYCDYSSTLSRGTCRSPGRRL